MEKKKGVCGFFCKELENNREGDKIFRGKYGIYSRWRSWKKFQLYGFHFSKVLDTWRVASADVPREKGEVLKFI